MSYQSYQPGYPLSEFVESFWAMHNPGAPSSLQRICPKGAMELVIHLAERTLSFIDGGVCNTIRAPLLAGPYSRTFLIDPSHFTAVVGVRFYPGAARLFFPVRADELHNLDIPLEDLLPAESLRLVDQLASARGFCGQCDVLEKYLSDKLRVAGPLHPAVRHALAEFMRKPGVRGIAEVQSETGFSHTRFIQLFRESVGMTPKLFCRLQRFRAVLERIEKGLPVSWAALAADCGYFDQAHLIRDFRAFAGVTPLEFLHVPESSTGRAAAARVAG
jgi:AraC-like DNA-binding protein